MIKECRKCKKVSFRLDYRCNYCGECGTKLVRVDGNAAKAAEPFGFIEPGLSSVVGFNFKMPEGVHPQGGSPRFYIGPKSQILLLKERTFHSDDCLFSPEWLKRYLNLSEETFALMTTGGLY